MILIGKQMWRVVFRSRNLWQLSKMSSVVQSKSCNVQKDLIALWTVENVLLNMGILVVLETCPVVKTLPALEAFVWLLTSMRSLVDHKTGAVSEPFSTVIA